ncbi:MAG: peptidoglycan DD-metalloendopeptidase family protein [Finegoldia sp.]|nr:peptidoglycan DD-metalloendopeptidase family protein [Finegoldia sp.]
MNKKIIAAVLSLSLLTNVSYADKLEDLNSQKTEKTQALDSQKANLKSLEEKHTNEINNLAKINQDVSAAENEVANKQKEIDQLNENIDATKADIEEIKNEIDEGTKEFQERLKTMYINQDSSKADMLLKSEDLDQLLNNISMMDYIASYDKEAIDELKHKKLELDSKERSLSSQLKSQEIAKQNLDEKLSSLNDLVESQQKLIDTVASDIDLSQKDIESLQGQISSLEGEIDKEKQAILQAQIAAAQRAEAQRRISESQGSYNQSSIDAPVVSSNGKYLQWPVPTSQRMTSFYGWRDNPTGYGTEFHTGLDIAAPMGTEIVAAEDGVVSSISSSGYGYGNLLKIQHDNGAETYYAHLSGFNVSVGQRVKRGELVAFMGSTGNSTGPHLHFEVRFDGQHTDPLNYLR